MTREQQLETLKKMRNDVCEDSEDDQALYYAIRAIENAERIAESAQNVQNDDLIFRKAAIDALGEKPLAWTEGEYELGLQQQWESDVGAIKELPAAQPEQKKGEWEEIEVIPEAYDIAGVKTWASKMRCNQCGFATFAIEGRFAQYNFCPNCGSYNGGEQE